ncbi:hypothetical protein H0R92_00495 [Treponema sp. OMZ 840]|uniref:hypothetical protein n=1 Tax=Treponema sp. OMZ 840 TaxID=244313 RepID=UPI003D8C10CB
MHKKPDFTKAIYGMCFVLLCTGIAGNFFKKNGKNLKEVQTALLNPKYAAEVNSIRIRHKNGQNELILRKTDFVPAMWTGEYTDTRDRKILFPADKGQIAALLDVSRKVRIMYIISDNNAQNMHKSPFFEPNDDFFGFEFLRDERLFSRFYVQKGENAAKTLISTDTGKIYAADGDLSTFLSYPALWADGTLFSDYARGGKSRDEVQKLVYSVYEAGGNLYTQKTFASGDTGFEKAVYNVFSARTSKIGAKPHTSFFAESKKSYEIRAVFSNGENTGIFIYPAGDTFIVVPSVLDYALEISAWTAANIGIDISAAPEVQAY